MMNRICKFCKKELINTKSKFCNMNCYTLYRRSKQIRKVCNNCGKEVIIRKRNLNRNKNFYCSLDCMYEFKKQNDLRETFVNDIYFNELNPQTCWLLGLLASDGNITKNKFIKICQSGDEGFKCINYIKRAVDFTGPIFSYLPKNSKNKVYALTINSKEWANKLKEYNIIPNKTKIFEIPKIIIENLDFLRWFLIGYIDGDGCIGIYSSRGPTNNKTYLVIELVCNQNVVKQLENTLTNFKPIIIKKSNSLFEIRFNNKKGYIFGKWLYSDINKIEIYKSYKYQKFNNYELNIAKQNNWFKYKNLYKQLKTDLKNNCFTSIREWGKLYKVGHTWIVKNKKLILKELENEA